MEPVQTKLDLEKAAPLLTTLLHALDTDAPDRANQILAQLAPCLPTGALRAVQDCVDNFDFRAAETVARQLARDHAIALKE